MPMSVMRVLAAVVVMTILAAPARAQAPAPETLAAARDLIATVKFSDQFNALMPNIMTGMKATIVQNRPEVERDYDAFVPALLDTMRQRLGELTETVALIYAENFTVDDLRAITAFYKTPVGQKYIEKTSQVTRQTMVAGQQFGKTISAEAQKLMVEELRKKGHTL